VEGGGRLTAALLRDRLIDRIYWFRAAGILGGDGLPMAVPFGVDRLATMARFERDEVIAVGPDLLEIYTCRKG
jgi:diaminohydroxyphosphoribosylaminopyrimidine deaminase/5-amino-6-(5-phosphoribosylamino)uracil reductase